MTGVAKHSDEACLPGFLFSEFREENISSLKSLQQHQGRVGVRTPRSFFTCAGWHTASSLSHWEKPAVPHLVPWDQFRLRLAWPGHRPEVNRRSPESKKTWVLDPWWGCSSPRDRTDIWARLPLIWEPSPSFPTWKHPALLWQWPFPWKLPSPFHGGVNPWNSYSPYCSRWCLSCKVSDLSSTFTRACLSGSRLPAFKRNYLCMWVCLWL